LPGKFRDRRKDFMRALFLLVGLGWIGAATLARAQTYDPNYPVCMQVIQMNVNYVECRYVSMAQCRESVSGRAGYCFPNPYRGKRWRAPGH
jgi:hypothetical protein